MVNYSNEELDKTFAALSDPTRRAILARLAEGEVQAGDLAAPFGISLPAVSKHLKVLEKAQLIRRRREGRIHRFTVNPQPMQAAMSWVEQYSAFWEQQLGALERYLESTSASSDKTIVKQSSKNKEEGL